MFYFFFSTWTSQESTNIIVKFSGRMPELQMTINDCLQPIQTGDFFKNVLVSQPPLSLVVVVMQIIFYKNNYLSRLNFLGN